MIREVARGNSLRWPLPGFPLLFIRQRHRFLREIFVLTEQIPRLLPGSREVLPNPLLVNLQLDVRLVGLIVR